VTVVGTVEVDVVALVNGNSITKQMSDGLSKPAATAGQTAGRTMGRHIGDSAAHELEKSGARFARSGRLLADVFTSNSASALGPLQEVADRVGLIGTALEKTRTKSGGAFLGIGAAATGVGAFLLTLQSREQGALRQLAASITAAGGNIDDYRGRIEEAVKAGERFGQSGNQTIDALQALTIGLHDPKKALDELGLAENIAAAKHISLSSAANLVRQAYNGNTRVLKAFGIQVSGIIDGQKLLADAHAEARKAASEAGKAQQEYSDKLAIYKDTLKPTLSQQIALVNAHDKVTKAQAIQAAAQQGLISAQTKANAAGSKGQEVLDQLAKVTAGQASAAASTFTGHLKAWGAAIEDNAIKIGGPAGKVLVEFGPALAAGGFLIESGLIPRLGRGVVWLVTLGRTAATTAVEVEGSSVAEVASLNTVVAAIRELQTAMVGIGPAAEAQAVEVGLATTAMDTELAGVATAAEEASVAAGASFMALLGPIGLVTAATAGLIILLNRAAHDKQSIANLDAGTPSATIKLPGKRNPVLTFNGQQFNNDGSGTQFFATAGNDNADRRGTRGLATAGNDNVDRSGRRATAAAPKPLTLEQRIAKLMREAGLDPTIASSSLNKALSDQQKAAGDRARAIGTEVTRGIRAQVATVKTEISGLNAEIRKISDLRGRVVGQAASFTSLTGLLPDNSLATAGGLVRELKSRDAAEALFGRNITSLGKRGLDKGSIADILKEGPERARSIAAALVAGSDSQIRDLNLELKASRQQAQVLGNQAVTAQFGVGAQAKANAELAKLNAQVAMLNKQIAAQPALIAKAVDQAQKNATVSKTAKARTAVTR
jgi:hypothetical protein